MKKLRGFTIIEMMISLTILSMVLIGIYGFFQYYSVSGAAATRNSIAENKARLGLDQIKKDIHETRGIYNNDTSTIPGTNPSFLASGITTSANVLVVRAFSVDASGAILDIADPDYTDFIVYWVNASKQLVRKAYKSNWVSSARDTDEYILADNIQGVSFLARKAGVYETLNNLTNSERELCKHFRTQLFIEINTSPGVTENVDVTMNVSFRNWKEV